MSMLKNFRLITSFVASFALIYSNYGFTLSMAKANDSFLTGTYDVKSVINIIKCSNEDLKNVDGYRIFKLKDEHSKGIFPTNGWVDLDFNDASDKYAPKIDPEYQWQAKCEGNGVLKYRYKNNDQTAQWSDKLTFSIKKKSKSRIDDNNDFDNLFSYVSCKGSYSYYKPNELNYGDCFSGVGCEINKADPKTYIQNYKEFNTGNSSLDDIITTALVNLTGKKGSYYGLFHGDGSRGVWSGELQEKNINGGETYVTADYKFSASCEQSKNDAGDMIFILRVNRNDYTCENSYQPRVPVMQYKMDNGSYTSSIIESAYELTSSILVKEYLEYLKQNQNQEEDIVIAKSSTCAPVQCLIKARGVDPFYVDPTPSDQKMYERKAIKEDYYKKDPSCAKWESREEIEESRKEDEESREKDGHYYVQKCWEETVEKERTERVERKDCSGWGLFGCAWGWVTSITYKVVRWVEKTWHCTSQIISTAFTGKVCVGNDWNPVPGHELEAFNSNWDCLTSKGQVPIVHYDENDGVAIATRGAAAIANRNMNEFYGLKWYGYVLQKGKCEHEDWISDNCPEPKVGSDGKSQCFTRKKGKENNSLPYQRKWCSDFGKKGWINYHCDYSGKATLYTQEEVIANGNAHPAQDFEDGEDGNRLDDQKFYQEAHYIHADNFTNLENKDAIDLYKGLNFFKDYGVGCCEDGSDEAGKGCIQVDYDGSTGELSFDAIMGLISDSSTALAGTFSTVCGATMLSMISLAAGAFIVWPAAITVSIVACTPFILSTGTLAVSSMISGFSSFINLFIDNE